MRGVRVVTLQQLKALLLLMEESGTAEIPLSVFDRNLGGTETSPEGVGMSYFDQVRSMSADPDVHRAADKAEVRRRISQHDTPDNPPAQHHSDGWLQGQDGGR